MYALTRTIPIVVIGGADLVEEGLANSFAHPGGNVTGIEILRGELDGKRLELLRELVPAVTRISFLAYARLPRSLARVTAVEALSRPLGVRVPRDWSAKREKSATPLPPAPLNRTRESWWNQESGALLFENQRRVVALAAQYRLPAVNEWREFAESGGLLSYGQTRQENSERAAALVDKILKGAKPADLPVEQPTRFELMVNLKTAAVLGLTIPQRILALADEIIE